MVLDANSLAVAVGSSVTNTQFVAEAEVLPRKVLIIGTYDPLKIAVVDEVPVLVTSAADVGDQFGFGFMVHRLAIQNEVGAQGIEMWIQPQSETGAASTGTITFAGTASAAGTVSLYVAGIRVPVEVANGDTPAAIATATVAAITADTSLPVTAVVNGGVPEQVDFTSKSKGPWGDEITLSFNWALDEAFPASVTAVIVAMSGGSGVPNIQDALDGLGTGDDQNLNHNTDLVHGYLQDSSTLDKLSVYNGIGQSDVGNYDKLVARPFRVLTGDTADGSAGLSALVTVANGRKTDRTNGVIAAPGSPNHPSEIAALALGIMARLNNNRAEESYENQILTGIIPGDQADRWTSDYTNRDTAVKTGISPTKYSNGNLVLQNVNSFYRPDSVPVGNNGYRSMRNISITQSILNTNKVNWQQEKWTGISIVADKAKVSNTTSRAKARDRNDVLVDLVKLTESFESNAWIFTAAFTIEKLQSEPSRVSIRGSGTGFDTSLPVIYSGEGGIFDMEVQFDISLAAVLGG